MAVAILVIVPIPVSVLVGAARDRSLRRRSRFWVRFVVLMTGIFPPWAVALVAPVGDQAGMILTLLGLAWSLLLVALAPQLLFCDPRSDLDPPEDDDGGWGPGDGDGSGRPDRPTGGIPLPDAEQSPRRLRGPHRPRRATGPRRPTREGEPRPSRVRPMRLLPTPITAS